ncbi:9972_t:CDS:2 [Gigaspora rosea]|nr:9972_t:CDS:2 [Gigaspora rosea]
MINTNQSPTIDMEMPNNDTNSKNQRIDDTNDEKKHQIKHQTMEEEITEMDDITTKAKEATPMLKITNINKEIRVKQCHQQ